MEKASTEAMTLNVIAHIHTAFPTKFGIPRQSGLVDSLRGVLAHDPRPSYQHDPARVYGMEFAGLEVHFTVDGETLTVTDITRR